MRLFITSWLSRKPWYFALGLSLLLLALSVPFLPFVIGGGLIYYILKKKVSLAAAIAAILIIGIPTLIIGNSWAGTILGVNKESPPQELVESPPIATQVGEVTAPEESGEYVLVSRVVDGDTIELEDGRKVRYIGIDTTESVHPQKPVECLAKEATQKNRELVEGKVVRLEKDISETDKYGRLLRYVYVGDLFVNSYLVWQGYAVASAYPPDVKYQSQFEQAQTDARDAGRGLWAAGACAGAPEEVLPATTAAPSAQEVKKATPPPASPPPVVAAPEEPTSNSCDCSETCSQIASCEEAYYQLNQCGCSARDGDNDGVPCEDLCGDSKKEEAPAKEPEETSEPSGYTCNCSKTCTQMSSCEEAYFQLNTCGCSKRDGDNDSIPCESICN